MANWVSILFYGSFDFARTVPAVYYRDQWSIVDGYLFWAWWRITGVGYPQDAFPNIFDHAARIIKRPSAARAMVREATNIEILKVEGLYIAPR